MPAGVPMEKVGMACLRGCCGRGGDVHIQLEHPLRSLQLPAHWQLSSSPWATGTCGHQALEAPLGFLTFLLVKNQRETSHYGFLSPKGFPPLFLL